LNHVTFQPFTRVNTRSNLEVCIMRSKTEITVLFKVTMIQIILSHICLALVQSIFVLTSQYKATNQMKKYFLFQFVSFEPRTSVSTVSIHFNQDYQKP
jgi:hypothetical protein